MSERVWAANYLRKVAAEIDADLHAMGVTYYHLSQARAAMDSIRGGVAVDAYVRCELASLLRQHAASLDVQARVEIVAASLQGPVPLVSVHDADTEKVDTKGTK